MENLPEISILAFYEGKKYKEDAYGKEDDCPNLLASHFLALGGG